jgi:LmbE family N-acetylglucosaminyl deacetylase
VPEWNDKHVKDWDIEDALSFMRFRSAGSDWSSEEASKLLLAIAAEIRPSRQPDHGELVKLASQIVDEWGIEKFRLKYPDHEVPSARPKEPRWTLGDRRKEPPTGEPPKDVPLSEQGDQGDPGGAWWREQE